LTAHARHPEGVIEGTPCRFEPAMDFDVVIVGAGF